MDSGLCQVVDYKEAQVRIDFLCLTEIAAVNIFSWELLTQPPHLW